MRKMIDTKCAACGKVVKDQLLDSAKIPACECGGVREYIHWTVARSRGVETSAALVVGDAIPGGIMMEHGICNADGTPRRYDSKTEIRAAAKAAGLVWGGDDGTRHVPLPGSDKAPHTVRFVGIPGALTQAQEDARVQAWHDHEVELQRELAEQKGA